MLEIISNKTPLPYPSSDKTSQSNSLSIYTVCSTARKSIKKLRTAQCCWNTLVFNASTPQMQAIQKATKSGFSIPLIQFLPHAPCPAILSFLKSQSCKAGNIFSYLTLPLFNFLSAQVFHELNLSQHMLAGSLHGPTSHTVLCKSHANLSDTRMNTH